MPMRTSALCGGDIVGGPAEQADRYAPEMSQSRHVTKLRSRLEVEAR